MSDRPRFFDDLAGVAGGALSALAGLREEAEALVRARIDEAIRKLELVRKEELDAMAELAANARAGQEAAEAQLTELADRVAVLEARWPVRDPAGSAGAIRLSAVRHPVIASRPLRGAALCIRLSRRQPAQCAHRRPCNLRWQMKLPVQLP